MWIYEAEQSSFNQMNENEREMCIKLMGKYISTFKNEINSK